MVGKSDFKGNPKSDLDLDLGFVNIWIDDIRPVRTYVRTYLHERVLEGPSPLKTLERVSF